ncbi:AAA family ATPase [Nostoc sp. TCL26-01]|uniref:AAA family ATPase n=1 Tax=Nostoc sp. TCL26-01 TaxID=2576904 RepID=UPI0015C048AD|nr:AAA family ATPase [Nostoc sp. TCL26-01]QLE57953.1 PAS domain S-box protein [Nostoc sp. TCL26-01]
MIAIPGIAIQNKIYESSASLVYRGIRVQDKRSLVVKMLKLDYPSAQELIRYKQEYEITRSLNLEGVVKAYSQQDYQRTLLILLEDFGGESLAQWMHKCPDFCPMPLSAFLFLAINLTDILGRIHAAHVIHRDINPGNIVLNRDTGVIKIIDFGIATRFNRTNPTFKSPHVLEGTLAYLSPEQTGRMNRWLDYRTDFYSLGVTFYELLTGHLPFPTTDILELVHCHIAKQPIPPHELNATIPKAISDIILKLMAKNAEDRYQSAWGIKADLESCDRQLAKFGQIDGIQLGLQDISHRFQIPQKLYGRDQEIAMLLAAFVPVACPENNRIAALQNNAQTKFQVEMMLVTGYAGVGKSALVQELYKPITAKRGYFIWGKFDQLGRNVPYSAMVDALRKLVQQLLGEPDEQLQQWRSRLLTALGSNGQLIVDVIPEIELIIGKQPPVPQVGATEAQNRFNRIFGQFVRVFCDKEHPLVIFLDDLQWIDSATLNLIELLLLDEQAQSLFLIGAYRNNEVNSTHPLVLTLSRLRQQGVVLGEIVLTPLTLEPLSQLIAETLLQDAKTVRDLAQLVLQKTEGNPFFVNEFLKTLNSEELVTFNVDHRCWQWDIAQIESKGITDNVVELTIGKLRQLPKPTQNALCLAACVGSEFDLNTLAIICQRSPTDIFTELTTAIETGLVLPTSELDENLLVQHYKFLHDRVQQAAYTLIDESQKPVVHLEIGRNLLQMAASEPATNLAASETLANQIFKIVDHLNLGAMLVTEQPQRDEIARLNLIAGQKARTATAYEAAVKYFHIGRSLLSLDSWQTNYDLSLTLSESAVEATYLCGNFMAMEHLACVVHNHAKTVLDEVKIYDVKIQAAASQGNLKQAIQIGLMVLARLGVELTAAPSQLDIQTQLEKTASQLADQEIADLINLKVMSQPEPLAAMYILSSITSLTFIAAPNLFPLISLSEVNLSIAFGNTTWSAHGYVCYGIVLCGIVQDIEAGYKFGKLALSLTERLNIKEVKAKIVSTFAVSVMHWQEHLKETLPLLLESYQSAMETGSFEFVGYGGFHIPEHSYFIGRELTSLEQEIATYSQIVSQVRRESPLNWIAILWQSVLNLLGRSQNPSYLMGDVYNEERSLPHAIEINDISELVFCYLNKLILDYLFGNYAQAIKNAMLTEQYLSGIPGRIAVGIYHFYNSLAHLARFAEVSHVEPETWLIRVNASQEKMRIWADHAPQNYQHKYDLVAAEKARVLGQFLAAEELYEQAIQGARDNEYLQEEALAYELAAKFYLARGREKIAQTYMREAHYCYQRWGAKAKVKDLETKYPQLLIQSPTIRTTDRQTIYSTTSSSHSGEALDLAAVMKASQAIASQIMLDQLLASLMKILIESAGAQSGCLILNKAGEWAIEASAVISTDAGSDIYTTEVLQSLPICDRLPTSIVYYVNRTKESVVVNNATFESDFANDSYIQIHQPKSILCAPLIDRGELIAIVYLENNLAVGAFTQKRVDVVQLLSGQAAIAITNANLYAQVKERESRLTQFIDAMPVGVSVHDLTGQITYANQAAFQLTGTDAIKTANIEQISAAYQVYIVGTGRIYPTAQLPIVRSLAGETLKVDNMEIHRPDRVVPLVVSSTPILNEKGEITGAIAAFQDITERKQAEKVLADYNRILEAQVAERTEALRQQKELLQTIFDHIPVMVNLYDANGRIQLVNRELEKVLGWNSAELQNIDLLVECYPDPEVHQQVLEHMMIASGKWQDFKTKTKNGRYIDMCWAQISLSNGMHIGIGQDISDRKRAEAASILEERNHMAREIHDTLAQAFTGIIIHARSASSKVIADPEKAQTLLTQILDLARSGLAEARRSVEALHRPYLLENGNLQEALSRLAAQLNSSIATQIVYEVIGTIYPLSSDLENNLFRIGQEALTNAIKYAKADFIRIELIYEPTQCSLRIKDDGQGFEVENQAMRNGFGLLGMAERAERIRAELKIQSDLGRGTEITVSIGRG